MTTHRHQRQLLSLQLLMVVSLCLCSDASAARLRTVVLSAQQADGFHGPEEFAYVLTDFRHMAEYGGESFSTDFPLINNHGDVAFVASTTRLQDGSFRRDGIWTERNRMLDFVIGSGDSLPGVDPDVSMRFIWGDISFNDRGEVAFEAITYDGSPKAQKVGSGIWAGTSDTLRNVATDIQPSSTTNSELEFRGFRMVLLNNHGHVAFTGQAILPGSGPPDERLVNGIWSDVTGSTRLVVQEGQMFGSPDGPSSLGWPSALGLSDDGDISIYASIYAQNGTGTSFLRVSEERIYTVVSEQQTQTASNGPIVFSTLEPPSHNMNGDFVFSAAIGYQWVLGAWHDGETRVIATEGDIAPGTDKQFQRFDGLAASINSSGRVAFRGFLHDYYQTYNGIWADASGPLELVARGGDPAPGVDAGEAFLYFSRPQLNARGDIAFSATLIGPGIDSDNDQGIWTRNELGILQLIAREGDLLEVASNDFRQIAALVYGGDYGEPGRTVFNDAGQLVFAALFTDGSSGIFVSDLAAIPEPSCLPLLLLPATTIFLNRRLRIRSLRLKLQ
jgi:hypothetical protein